MALEEVGNEGAMGGNEELESKISKFVNELRWGPKKSVSLEWCDWVDTYEIALSTAQLLRELVSQAAWADHQELRTLLIREGRRMMGALPDDHWTVANIIKRALKLLREECARSRSGGDDVLEVDEDDDDDGGTEGGPHPVIPRLQLRNPLIEAINELITEIETSSDNIAMQAPHHIHSNDIVLTAGHSRTVEKFLKAAAKKWKFQVIIAECAPFYQGHSLAASLDGSQIETTVIADSAVFALMSRVNKVVIGAHTILANGGLRALVGSHVIALAAAHYSTPSIVLSAMYKLAPQLKSEAEDGFHKLMSPGHVCDGHLLGASDVRVYNPVYDYVPPHLVTLLISNICGNSPSYIYRLLQELYHPDDYHL